ncbi:hypothetical protein [Brachybacterium huguangmaarense]
MSEPERTAPGVPGPAPARSVPPRPAVAALTVGASALVLCVLLFAGGLIGMSMPEDLGPNEQATNGGTALWLGIIAVILALPTWLLAAALILPAGITVARRAARPWKRAARLLLLALAGPVLAVVVAWGSARVVEALHLPSGGPSDTARVVVAVLLGLILLDSAGTALAGLLGLRRAPAAAADLPS